MTTASRVFANPDRVNAQTRETVLSTARELGYLPPSKRSRSAAKAGRIGLIVPDIDNPFFPPMIKSIQRWARSRGFTVVLADTDDHRAGEQEAVDALVDQVDGLIMWSARLPAEELTELAGRVPLVCVNRGAPNVNMISATTRDGMRQAVEHLYALAHQRCCYVNGPRTMWSNKNRRAAVREACRALRLEFVEVGPFPNTYEGGVQAADLVAASGATAAIASNDLAALGLVQRLQARGIDVPRDVSVVGVDDTILARTSSPPLTSVRLQADEIGVPAVDTVIGMIRGEDRPPETIEVESQLIVRGSTGTAATTITWPVRPLPA